MLLALKFHSFPQDDYCCILKIARSTVLMWSLWNVPSNFMSWECCVYQSVILVHNIKKKWYIFWNQVWWFHFQPQSQLFHVYKENLCNLGYKVFSQEGSGSWNRCSVSSCRMGQTLSEPVTTKETSSCSNKLYKVGSSCMQGWRISILC